jgi:hypothetical protein
VRAAGSSLYSAADASTPLRLRRAVSDRKPLEPLEYFAVEALARATIGNSAFPRDKGLLIGHVDEHVTTSNTFPQMTPAEHYRVSVEQADGLFDLERPVNPGDAGDVWVPGTRFGPWARPYSDWWDGTPSGMTIDDIRFLSNGRISFRRL